jgi:hypothetical protein
VPINKNHEFDDLDGVKCAIVERNVLPERVAFLKNLLEYNRFTVVVVPSPPPKPVAAPVATTATAATQTPVSTEPAALTTPPVTTETSPAINAPLPTEIVEPTPPPPPESFTVGVTDVTFNAINAIFGRLLRTRDGRVVTLAYWHQKEDVASDEIPYFDNN